MGEAKYSNKLSRITALMWYGPVALAGVLLFVANNGLLIWDRLKPTEIFVEATRKVTTEVKPDTAKIVLTAKHTLADSAKEASVGIGKKVDDFQMFVTSLPEVKLAILPLSVSQDVIQIGEKFARSYTASQSIELTVKDFSLIKRIIEQAVASEIGDIGGTEFALASTSAARKNLRERVIKEANAEAAAKAKELGRTLDKMVDFSENNNVYHASDSDLEGEDEMETPELEAGGEESPAELSNHFGTIKVYQSVSVKYLTK